MRILHIFDHSIPLHSGYTFRSAAILRGQRALGWETFHLTSPKHGRSEALFEDVDGLRFYRTPGAVSAVPLVGQIQLMRALEARIATVAREVRPNVIHAHSPVLNVLPALRAGKRLGIPVVYEIRAFWEDAAVDHGTTQEGSSRYRLTRALETHALRNVAHAFTICEGLRAEIVTRGIPSERVTVIPNAVDVDSFQPAGLPDEALRVRLGLADATVVGFVGSFYAYEGLDLLLDAVPVIAERFPLLKVLLVGGGPQEANLKARADRLGIAHRVIFAGRVPHSEVGRYYDLIDLLAYPRHSMRLTELVTPLKPLEAMAQGRVFVASDVGGHRELVRHGETGRLFLPGSAAALATAVCEMLGEQSAWGEYRAAGRRFVESERTWSRSVEAYRAPYSQLTES